MLSLASLALIPCIKDRLGSSATSSAGITSLVFLQMAAAPRPVQVVRQEVGDRMRLWSEGGDPRLPNSGAVQRFSTGFHAYDGSCGLPNACYRLNDIYRPKTDSYGPDQHMPFRFEDYARETDMALATILHLTTG